ncbi:Hypothetical_protein [Hexamita inflata]|uniref:Hypothetical_protein n=1 Tax=Hexamita inflata TaxID=28002 RepID=A0AA86QB97_9EUKA|nr:Hypothetical protein HINF_LOCUS41471 [Hexamita inflata]
MSCSKHSTQLSQDSVQLFHNKIVMAPLSKTIVKTLLPDTIFYISQVVVYFIITHYLYQFVDNHVGLVACIITYVVLNLVTILVSDAVVEAGLYLVGKSLETKKNGAAKMYFAYTVVVGVLTTFIISFTIVIGARKQLTNFILWSREQIQVEKQIYNYVAISFILTFFISSLNKLTKVEGKSNLVLNYLITIIQLYVIQMSLFLIQMMGKAITPIIFIPCLIIPVIISAVYSLFQAFHFFSKKILYNNILFIEMNIFKPLRPKVQLEILKLSFHNIFQNVSDALILLFTVQLVTYSDVPVVAYTLLQLELTNVINKSISNNLSSVFRLNMQLKRYDRVFSLFLSLFPLMLVNLAYQVFSFSVRNKLYKLVFNNLFDSTMELFHGSVDGFLGIFSAYSSAVLKSNPNSKISYYIGSFKLIISISFWLTAKYTNYGNTHCSSMLYYYKYCTDLIGFGLYVIYFKQFYLLKKKNCIQEQFGKEPEKLVLRELEIMEPLNISEESQSSKTKEPANWPQEEINGSCE